MAELIGPGRVILNLRAREKEQLLQELSRLASPLVTLAADQIHQALQKREQLGSTGIGRGIALPHARVDGIEKLFGMFVRLSRPIEFQAIDEKPVDLIFLLLIPPDAGNEHVAALAAISRRLRDPDFTQRLRKADKAEKVLALFQAS
ncbi:MAG: PTS sugar transporter subunit IIA [Acetobacteraceae bacterium]|nr:PTS sugar transporter subunit IIA [Acetobacteraceae bacterium]